MKKNIKYFMMAAVALLSMSACNNEMDEQQINTVKGEPVKFQMTTTRTSTGTDYTTTFVKGDAVGIFAFERNTNGTDGNPAVTNAKYVLSTDGTTWEPANPENAAYADPNIAFNYYAYYPYQEGASTPQSINMAVKLDQSTDVANYNTSDVLTAQNRSAEANSTTVPLNFKHAFALVQVNLEGDASDKDAIVTILNVFPEASLNLQHTDGAKAAGEAKGVQSAVKMYSLPEINQIENAARFAFRAIVPAQNISANTALLEIQSKGKTYRFTYSTAVDYVAEASRIINVTLGNSPTKNTISFPASDMTVDKWGTTTTVEGEGNVEDVTPLVPELTTENLLWYYYDSDSKTPNTSNKWFAYTNKKTTDPKTIIISIDKENETPTINYSIGENINKDLLNWNNSSFGFTLDNLTKDIYELSFDLKVDNTTESILSTSNKVGLSVFARSPKYKGSTDDIGGFLIVGYKESETQGTSLTYATLTTGDTWTTDKIKIRFNLNKYIKGPAVSTPTDFATTSDNLIQQVHFGMTYNGTNLKHKIHIRNVKLEKVTPTPAQ